MQGTCHGLLGECGWSNIPSLSVTKQSISLCIPPTVEKKSFGNICRNVVPDAAHVMPGVIMDAAFRLN
jgi:hypothetical protein